MTTIEDRAREWLKYDAQVVSRGINLADIITTLLGRVAGLEKERLQWVHDWAQAEIEHATDIRIARKEAQREACEDVLGIYGIGNGYMLSELSDDEDLPAHTSGLFREYEDTIKARAQRTTYERCIKIIEQTELPQVTNGNAVEHEENIITAIRREMESK